MNRAGVTPWDIVRFIKPWASRASSTHARCSTHHWPGSSRRHWSSFRVVLFETCTLTFRKPRVWICVARQGSLRGPTVSVSTLSETSNTRHHLFPQTRTITHSLRKKPCYPTIGKNNRLNKHFYHLSKNSGSKRQLYWSHFLCYFHHTTNFHVKICSS